MLRVAIFVGLLWLGIGLDSVARRSALGLTVATLAAVGWLGSAPESHADNKRLNDGVVANVYTVQQQAGCTNEGDDHYRSTCWDEAYRLIADKLRALAGPNEAVFYTSGRTSNEAAIHQFFCGPAPERPFRIQPTATNRQEARSS
jgi:hypothetical protein